MRDSFIKIAAGSPQVRVGDCAYNTDQIIRMIGEAAAVVSAATLALSGAITEATTAVGFAEAVRTTK